MQLSETIADEAPTTSRWASTLAHATEIPAALLVLAEIVILGGGAFSRYVLRQPITWTDELASILFVWLAMLGAVIALRRGEHMQLTTFVKDVSPEAREWLDALGMFLVMAFLLLLAVPAYEHFQEDLDVVTPTLEISEGYRTGAVVVGTALMLLTAIARLFARAHWKQILATGTIVAAIAVALWLLSPTLQRLGNVNLVIFFVVMLVFCIVIGVPIAFAFGLATMSYLAFATTTPMSIMPSRMQEGMSHLILLAVPLFVFLGGLIEMTGLAKAVDPEPTSLPDLLIDELPRSIERVGRPRGYGRSRKRQLCRKSAVSGNAKTRHQ